ncbi:hypothetical protein H6503_00525 [Candidatus Woesearchaeota archaeon]|nr:hypothetical protein [Candidatus Woesearchaeota archaeon]
MAEVSTFRSTLIFFDKLGIYDVILPFLLVFTIVFAILEKTKVLGTEVIEGQKLTKKNLNAMTAFVIAFLSVASSRMVAIINQTAAHIVLLLLVSVFFLMLVGSFMKEGDKPVYLEGKWQILFMIIMFIGIVVIFMNAITYEGRSWLQIVFDWLGNFNNSNAVSSIVLVIVLIGFMYFVIRGADQGNDNKKMKSE